MKRVHVYASGRVQGVFYRAECARHARALELSGFVRNLPDGRVEAAFEGPTEQVDEMLAWCGEGTEWSHVERLDLSEEAPTGEGGFRVAG